MNEKKEGCILAEGRVYSLQEYKRGYSFDASMLCFARQVRQLFCGLQTANAACYRLYSRQRTPRQSYETLPRHRIWSERGGVSTHLQG